MSIKAINLETKRLLSIFVSSAVGIVSHGAARADAIVNNTFDAGREGWQVYDYNGLPYPQTGGTNVFYPATWHNSGGVNDTAYISGDDSMWRIDVPENPNSILAFIIYQNWVGAGPIDIRNKTLSVYLRGDNLNLKGANVYFWALRGGTRWHYTAQPLTVLEGSWGQIQIFQLVNDENLWHLSWSHNPSSPTSLDGVLSSVDSFGFSFAGFAAGDEPTGSFAMDELSIYSTNNVSYPLLFHDDFQSDVAGTASSTGDLDPAIGAGDTGGTWTVNEYGANYLQVLNDTVPGNNIAGTNNYVSIVRTTSITHNGGAYGSGWNPSLTLNQLVQLDFKLWQGPPFGVGGQDLGVVLLNQSPPSGPANFDYDNFATAWTDLTFTDSTWHAVHIVANLGTSATKSGLAPQTYSLSLDGGPPTVHSFHATNHQVGSIGFYGGGNNMTAYLDEIVFEVVVPEPLTVSIAENKTLTFMGSPGTSYVVETSTNMTAWISISTNMTDGAGKFSYSDPVATNFTQRFYRGRLQ